jgi:hypothetical protein
MCCLQLGSKIWCMDTCWMMHDVASYQRPAWFGVCVWCRVPGSFFVTELHFARTEPPSTLLSVLEGIGCVEKYFTHTYTHTHTHLLTEFAVLMPSYIPPWWWRRVWNMYEEHQWQEVIYYWLYSLLAQVLCNSWSSMFITTQWLPSLVARTRYMGFSSKRWSNSSL